MTDPQTAEAGGAGLVRHEQNRATALWAAGGGGGGMVDASESLQVPLATEVAAVEFLYHDGIEWIEEWNTNQQGDLPKAVRITIWIIPVSLRGSGTDTTSQTESDWLAYQLTVHLPMAGEGGP